MALFDNQPPDNLPRKIVDSLIGRTGTVLGFEGEYVVKKQNSRGILTVTDKFGENEKIITASMFSVPDKT